MALTPEQIAEIAARAPQGATAPEALPSAPFEGQHVEGDEAFFRSPDGKIYGAPSQNVELALQENPS